jgi:hypothetical protein
LVCLHRIITLRTCSCRDLYFSKEKRKGGKSIAPYINRKKELAQFYGETGPETEQPLCPKSQQDSLLEEHSKLLRKTTAPLSALKKYHL